MELWLYPRSRQRLVLLLAPFFSVGMSSYGIHFSVKLVEFNIYVTDTIKNLVILAVILALMPIFKKVS